MDLSRVQLNGTLVSLRDFVPDDALAAYEVVGDPRVTEYLSFDTKTLEQTEAMLTGIVQRSAAVPRTEFYLAVEAAGSLVGFARLGLDGVQAAKIGYAVHADHWGNGYATDAVKTLVDFAFHDLGLHRVSAAIGPDNPASVAVVKHLGFVHEGKIRDHVYTNGAWRDSLLYSALSHEWANLPTEA